jgi:hypothetical protein
MAVPQIVGAVAAVVVVGVVAGWQGTADTLADLFD